MLKRMVDRMFCIALVPRSICFVTSPVLRPVGWLVGWLVQLVGKLVGGLVGRLEVVKIYGMVPT